MPIVLRNNVILWQETIDRLRWEQMCVDLQEINSRRLKNIYFCDPEEVEQEDKLSSSDDESSEEIGDGSDCEGADMSDVEADADTLRSAGWGTDEDYGYYGSSDD